MKYIIFNDLVDCFKNRIKLITSYFLMIMVIFLFQIVIKVEITNNIIYETLGLKCLFYEQDWIQIVIYTFIIVFYIYLALSIFMKDLKNNAANIFLRVKPQKWLIYKTLSIMVIDIIIMFITYILIILLYFFFYSMLNFNLTIIFNNYLYVLTLQFIFLSWYIIFSKSPFLAMSLLILFLAILHPYTSIIQIPLIYLIIAFILIYSVLVVVNNLFYIDVFEGS